MLDMGWQAEENQRSEPGQQYGEAANQRRGLSSEECNFVRSVEIGKHQHGEDQQPERSNECGNQASFRRGPLHPVRHGFDDDFLLLFSGFDLLGLQFDERLDERGHFGALGQLLQCLLRKIDPRFTFRKAADVQFDDKTIFIGRSHLAAQDIPVGQLEIIGEGGRTKLPAQAHGQPD